MFICLSYQKNYELTCSRSCNCREGGADSDFAMFQSHDIHAIAQWIAKRVIADDHADFIHFVYKHGEPPVIDTATYEHCTPMPGRTSAEVFTLSDDNGDYPDWLGNLRTLTTEAIAKEAEKKKKAYENRQRELKDREERERRTAQEREYERLKKELGK